MTKLVRYTPNLELDRFFENFFSPRPQTALTNGHPRVELSETETAYRIELDLPGLTKKDININFENGVLTISGERTENNEDEGRTYYRTERYYGSFSRSFTFPKRIDIESIKAHFRNGVLAVDALKAEESKPRRIEIK